ncbi:MAG TPA: VOC family protein [Deinococcales bacterium]|nr:VOC family protein [Deinococcales bacterium]
MNFPQTIPYLDLPADRIGRKPTNHVAPATARPGTVTLQVADLERSLAFYQDVIGLHPLPATQTGGARHAKLGTRDGQHLLELREKPGVRPARHRGRLGLYHFALLLPDRAALGRFIRNALALGVHVGRSDHHYSEATYLVDPDGLSIEVYRDRPREEWRVTENGEIIGGGDPLDLDAVLEAAGDEPWTGVPDGTNVGHMHFYVNDLEEAARFYHDGLGLSKVTWTVLPSGLFLSAGGYHHHVGLNTWAAGSAPSSDEDARLLTWDLLLPDEASVRATADSLAAAGFPVETNAEGGPVSRDPWGIAVRLRIA